MAKTISTIKQKLLPADNNNIILPNDNIKEYKDEEEEKKEIITSQNKSSNTAMTKTPKRIRLIEDLFHLMDADSDGKLTKKEVLKGLYFRPDVSDMIDKIDEKNLKLDTEELNNICDECKEEDESVTQNLILTGFKICKSCRVSKTIFPL